MVVSQSDGRLAYYSLDSGGPSLTILQSWKAHDFEAWVAAFDYWSPQSVYSGGDDTLFKGWDVRTPVSTPTFVSKRYLRGSGIIHQYSAIRADRHEAGVCSISSHHLSEHILATGRYDLLSLWIS